MTCFGGRNSLVWTTVLQSDETCSVDSTQAQRQSACSVSALFPYFGLTPTYPFLLPTASLAVYCVYSCWLSKLFLNSCLRLNIYKTGSVEMISLLDPAVFQVLVSFISFFCWCSFHHPYASILFYVYMAFGACLYSLLGSNSVECSGVLSYLCVCVQTDNCNSVIIVVWIHVIVVLCVCYHFNSWFSSNVMCVIFATSSSTYSVLIRWVRVVYSELFVT